MCFKGFIRVIIIVSLLHVLGMVSLSHFFKYDRSYTSSFSAASLLSSRLITSFNSLLSILSWTSSVLGIFLAHFFDLQLDCCCPLSSDLEFPWWTVRFCPVTYFTLDPEDSACFPCGFQVAMVLLAFFVGFAIGSCNRVKLLVLF